MPARSPCRRNQPLPTPASANPSGSEASWSSPALRKQKQAPKTSATQRSQRPLSNLGRLRRTTPDRTSLLRRLLAVGVAFGGAGQNLLGDQAGILTDRHLDLGGHVGIGLEECF